MRGRAVGIAIALVGAAVVPIAVPEAGASPVAYTAGCVHARIGGKRECLSPGKPCNHRFQSQYARYGLSCIKFGGSGYRLTYGGQQ
jgi:hypothetical protein